MRKLSRKYVYILFCLLFMLQSSSCIWTVSKKSPYTSIFARNRSLSIIAEAFPEYEWNENAKNAYSIYLQSLNDYYFSRDYETAIILFFDALDMNPNDARVYVRLAESQARIGDFESALRTLNSAEPRLSGFLSHPAIEAYIDELNRASQMSPEEFALSQPEGIVSRATSLITWLPRKTFGFFRNLF